MTNNSAVPVNLADAIRTLCEDGYLFEDNHFKRMPEYLKVRIKAVWTAYAAAPASAPVAHPQTDNCGFDRNASSNVGHYVCMCGYEDSNTTMRAPLQLEDDVTAAPSPEQEMVGNMEIKNIIEGYYRKWQKITQCRDDEVAADCWSAYQCWLLIKEALANAPKTLQAPEREGELLNTDQINDIAFDATMDIDQPGIPDERLTGYIKHGIEKTMAALARPLEAPNETNKSVTLNSRITENDTPAGLVQRLRVEAQAALTANKTFAGDMPELIIMREAMNCIAQLMLEAAAALAEPTQEQVREIALKYSSPNNQIMLYNAIEYAINEALAARRRG